MHTQTDSSKNEILSRYITILGNCYSKGNFDELFPLLSEDVVWESQHVLEPRTGKAVVVDYFINKGIAFRKSDCCPHCWMIKLVDNLSMLDCQQLHINGGAATHASVGLMYPENKYAMLMTQTLDDVTRGIVVDLTLDSEDMITRIDLCMPEFYQFEIVRSVDAVSNE